MIQTYPESPGFKVAGTSQESAKKNDGRAVILREAVFDALKVGPATADELAERIGENVLSVRPRVSELRAKGRLIDTMVRRRNASGHRAIVWAPKLVQGQLV